MSAEDSDSIFVIKSQKMPKKMKSLSLCYISSSGWRVEGMENQTVLTDQSYLKKFLLTPIQKLTISIQHLALCPNTNYVRI